MQSSPPPKQLPIQQFQKAIKDDPVNFLLMAGFSYWSKQAEIMRSIFRNKRTVIKSCHGSGKTFILAATSLAWLLAHGNDTLALNTAPTFRQVRNVFWKEMRRAINRSKLNLGGSLSQTKYEITEDIFAMGFSADNPDAISGFHALNLLFLGDEAAGISDELLDPIDGALTSANNHLALIGNPTSVTGRFFRAFQSPLYHKISISAFDTPNFTSNGIKTPEQLAAMSLEEVEALPIVAPFLVTPMWVWERAIEWGIDSPPFQSRVMANFVEDAEDSLIKLLKVQRAFENEKFMTKKYQKKYPNCVIGVDPAYKGKDKTVIYVMRGKKRVAMSYFKGQDTNWTTAKIKEYCEKYPVVAIGIDATGIGVSIVDNLVGFRNSKGYEPEIIPIHFGSASSDPTKYFNLKAEIFWYLRELFEDEEICIKDEGNIFGDLCSIRYHYDGKQRIVIVSKKDLKKKGLPSPDFADALAIACWVSQMYNLSNSFSLSRSPVRARVTSRRRNNRF